MDGQQASGVQHGQNCFPRASASKSSCAWAQHAGSSQGTAPSGLPCSNAMIGCFSHRPDAFTCHSRRSQPAQAGRGAPLEPVKAHHWPAVMTPRLIGLPADDAVSSHRAAGGADPSIEGARRYAGATSRGAAGRFLRVRPETAEKRSAASPFIDAPVKRQIAVALFNVANFLYQHFRIQQFLPLAWQPGGESAASKQKGCGFNSPRTTRWRLLCYCATAAVCPRGIGVHLPLHSTTTLNTPPRTHDRATGRSEEAAAVGVHGLQR